MSDGIETNVVLLTANFALFIIIIGGFAGTSVALLVTAMAALILINLYKISPEVQKIRKEILRNKKLLLIQRRKLNEQKKLLDAQRKKVCDVPEGERILVEVSKISENGSSDSGGMRMEHWERIEKKFGEINPDSDEAKLAELEDKKNEIQGLIELSRKKYHQRILDEQSFREITKDYKRRLIEVESEINKFEKKKENN